MSVGSRQNITFKLNGFKPKGANWKVDSVFVNSEAELGL